MGENEYFQCSSCESVYDANANECPNCGGEGTLEKKVREAEPEMASSETTEDGVSELSPDQIRQTEAARLAAEGGTPQRPSP